MVDLILMNINLNMPMRIKIIPVGIRKKGSCNIPDVSISGFDIKKTNIEINPKQINPNDSFILSPF